MEKQKKLSPEKATILVCMACLTILCGTGAFVAKLVHRSHERADFARATIKKLAVLGGKDTGFGQVARLHAGDGKVSLTSPDDPFGIERVEIDAALLKKEHPGLYADAVKSLWK